MSRQCRGPAAPRDWGRLLWVAHRPRWGHPPSARAAPHASGRPRTATRVSPAPPATQLQHRRLLPACTSGARFWGVLRRQKLIRYTDQGHFTEERVWLSRPSLLGGTPVAPEESSLGDGDGARLGQASDPNECGEHHKLTEEGQRHPLPAICCPEVVEAGPGDTHKQGRPWMELGAPASYRPEASPSCLMSRILNNTTSSRLTPTLPGNLVLRGPPAQGP